jgi:hypothetical protein
MSHRNGGATGKLLAANHDPYNVRGGEKGPVILPAFKAGDSVLDGRNGGFDSHTLPPNFVL